jgi:hypothetical protein
MKKTAWYPGTVKPVRIGFYERIYCTPILSFWDGRRWMLSAASRGPIAGEFRASIFQTLQWRGLQMPSGGDYFSEMGERDRQALEDCA